MFQQRFLLVKEATELTKRPYQLKRCTSESETEYESLRNIVSLSVNVSERMEARKVDRRKENGKRNEEEGM